MKIESGIKFMKDEGRGRPNKYPFGEMEVGDSFPVPEGDGFRSRCAASAYGKRYSMKFSVRKYEGGYRCWRVA